VLGAYVDYAAAAPNIAHLPALAVNTVQKEALIHAYSVETKPFSKLRDRLFKPVMLAQCPFCGFGEASTLDHYLPKELHPQFAVYSRNLVPCCSKCNTRKSNLIVDKVTDVRLFLHPYYDIIPNVCFLSVQVTLQPDAIDLSFRLHRTDGIALDVFRHLQSHFRLLQLADRYRLQSLMLLRGKRQALERFYGPNHDADRVAAELTTDANDREADFGPNDWQTILYRELAANAAFCNGGFAVLDSIQ
jgi:hypothetical protein